MNTDIGHIEVTRGGTPGSRLDMTMFSVAIIGSLLFHSSLFLVLLIANILGIDLSRGFSDNEDDELSSVSIVPARLVRLGEEPEPGKLHPKLEPLL